MQLSVLHHEQELLQQDLGLQCIWVPQLAILINQCVTIVCHKFLLIMNTCTKLLLVSVMPTDVCCSEIHTFLLFLGSLHIPPPPHTHTHTHKHSLTLTEQYTAIETKPFVFHSTLYFQSWHTYFSLKTHTHMCTHTHAVFHTHTECNTHKHAY